LVTQLRREIIKQGE